MKEILNKSVVLRSREFDTDGKSTDSVREMTIREVIMNPAGIHVDDVLNAIRYVMAAIIVEFDAHEAAEDKS